MRNYFPKIGFHRKKDDELATDAGAIYHAMDGNDTFKAPVPPLEELGSALELYRSRLERVRATGALLDTTLKKQSRIELMRVLRDLGSYVRRIAKGDPAIIHSSGFELCADPTPGGTAGTPELVKLLHTGRTGELYLKFDAVKNAISYEYRIRIVKDDDPSTEWQDRVITHNSVKTLISGLKRKEEYEVQVRSVNRHGYSNWSEPARQIVL